MHFWSRYEEIRFRFNHLWSLTVIPCTRLDNRLLKLVSLIFLDRCDKPRQINHLKQDISLHQVAKVNLNM